MPNFFLTFANVKGNKPEAVGLTNLRRDGDVSS